MTVVIKRPGEFLSASELVEYVREAGERYGLPRLASVDHPNKLTKIKNKDGLPDPEFTLAGRDAWRKESLDTWVDRKRDEGVALVLECARTLGDDELLRLYEELGKRVGAAPKE